MSSILSCRHFRLARVSVNGGRGKILRDVTIIAEAGVNHNGDIDRAVAMVDVAADAGAEYVKFQAFRAGDLVATTAATAGYQATNTGVRTQYELLKPLEIDIEGFRRIGEQCRQRNIKFLCTPFTYDMTPQLISVGMDAIKVPSGEVTNKPMLEYLAGFGFPIILSTGMADAAEVGKALTWIEAAGLSRNKVTLLHCTSLYPAPFDTLNLSALQTMRDQFDCDIGYSDHSLGDHASIAAVALGAKVIEKHFTLDRNLPGPDHKASLEPAELAAMVSRLRDIAAALGHGRKEPHPLEASTAAIARRSWHAIRNLPAGHKISASDVAVKRPLGGLPPENSPVGMVLAKAIAAETALSSDFLS